MNTFRPYYLPQPKLPEPDTTYNATFPGASVKYHSDDQIIEYGNARAIDAVSQAFERAARNRASCAPPLEVVVERGRVWLRRAHQSFMLDYDSDVPAEREWYANQLRAVLGLPIEP